MSAKVLRGADKKKDAEKLLKERPILVLFFMDGCPHCEANKPAWDALKKESNVPVAEIEASATPETSGVTSFPTVKLIKENGEEETTEGAKQSAAEIKRELRMTKKGGRRTRKMRRSRRKTLRRIPKH